MNRRSLLGSLIAWFCGIFGLKVAAKEPEEYEYKWWMCKETECLYFVINGQLHSQIAHISRYTPSIIREMCNAHKNAMFWTLKVCKLQGIKTPYLDRATANWPVKCKDGVVVGLVFYANSYKRVILENYNI